MWRVRVSVSLALSLLNARIGDALKCPNCKLTELGLRSKCAHRAGSGGLWVGRGMGRVVEAAFAVSVEDLAHGFTSMDVMTYSEGQSAFRGQLARDLFYAAK